MYRRLQKVKKTVSFLVMAAVLGTGAPAQSISAHAQESTEAVSAVAAGESTKPQDTASGNTKLQGTASRSSKPETAETEGMPEQKFAMEYTGSERMERAREWSQDDVHKSSDQAWYYIDRSLIDDKTGIVLVGRDTAASEEAEGVVSTYTEAGDEKLCYTIPSVIDGKNVTAIGDPDQTFYVNPEEDAAHCALNGLGDYDLVEVPEGVDTIYPYCFSNSDFKEVRLPDTLITIGDRAFENVCSLEQINIPLSVLTIDAQAFFGTTWLSKRRGESDQSLVIENRILLDGIDAAGDVVIPSGVRKISPEAFHNARITSVTIPDSVVEIGEESFHTCRQLTRISIGKGVVRIGDTAFDGTAIEELTLPSSVRELGVSMCCLCRELKTVKIWGSITELPEGAFANCPSLQTITIPEGVTSIGNRCFLGCANLTEVTLPEAVTKIGERAFISCSKLQLELPGHVTEIGDYAFQSCKSLSKITLPKDLTKLGALAFQTQGNESGYHVTITVPEQMTDISGLGLISGYILLRVVEGGSVEAYLRKNKAYPYLTYQTGCETIEAGTKTVIAPPQTDEDDAQGDPDGSGASEEGKETEKGNEIVGGDGSGAGETPSGGDESGTGETSSGGDESGAGETPSGGDESGAGENSSGGDESGAGETRSGGDESGAGETPSGGDGSGAGEIRSGGDESGVSGNSAGEDGTGAGETTTSGGNTGTGEKSTVSDGKVTNIDQSTTNIDQSTVVIDQSSTTIITRPSDEQAAVDEKRPADESLVGKVFTYKKCKYQIGADEKTVTFVCPDKKNMTKLTIPDKAVYQKKKYNVVSVAKNACKGMKKLQTVTIGAYVEEIGPKAFSGCVKLKTLLIGKRVEEIGKMAFYGDSALKKLTFKNIKALKTVDTAAFYLKGKKTDKHLKKKSTSKKLLLGYLKNSGVSVTAK